MTLTPESLSNLIQPNFALAYDSAGNVGTITHGIAGGSSLATFAYAYDAANRLTHETNAEGSVTYTYDNTPKLSNLLPEHLRKIAPQWHLPVDGSTPVA